MKNILMKMIRVASNKDESLTILYVRNKIDSFIIEDEHREVKVKGETRLRPGIHPLKVRTSNSTMNEQYKKKFPGWHKGMIEIITPDFKDTYLHIGNKEVDTMGCPLPNAIAYIDSAGRITGRESTVAYERMYKKCIEEILLGDSFIEIKDLDV
jgi:hypothetical protein